MFPFATDFAQAEGTQFEVVAESLKDLRTDLTHVLSQSRLRLDSLRLVWKSPT